MNNPDQPQSPPTDAGRRLAAARAEWGASVSEVAAYLNLSDATIEALESGAHERLPGMTFVKGYLRAYAKLLNLDPDEIIGHAGFAPEALNEIPVAHVPLRAAHKRARKRRRLARAAIAAAVLLALAGWAAVQLTPDSAVERVTQMFSFSALDSPLDSTPDPAAPADGISFPEDAAPTSGR